MMIKFNRNFCSRDATKDPLSGDIRKIHPTKNVEDKFPFKILGMNTT